MPQIPCRRQNRGNYAKLRSTSGAADRRAGRSAERGIYGEEARFRDRLGRPLHDVAWRRLWRRIIASPASTRRAARPRRSTCASRSAAATERSRPSYGLTFGYGQTVGGADARRPHDRRRAVNLADIRFNRSGELRNARVASFDLANLDRDRRMNLTGGGNTTWIIVGADRRRRRGLPARRLLRRRRRRDRAELGSRRAGAALRRRPPSPAGAAC